jgi:hypothetical protein
VVIPLDVPVMLLLESRALMVQVPALFKVAEKVPLPLDTVPLAGNVAVPSVLLKLTVPL